MRDRAVVAWGLVGAGWGRSMAGLGVRRRIRGRRRWYGGMVLGMGERAVGEREVNEGSEGIGGGL